MKLMVISDIHGSAHFLNQAIEAFRRERADRILILGDVLYHGPRNDLPQGYAPKEVAEILNGLKDKILCVKGNCDSEVDQCVLEFPIMAEYVIIDFDGKTVFATHGHKLDGEYKTLAMSANVVLSGHTHVPVIEKRDGVIYANPGSVSIPKDDSKHGYAILESQKLLLKTSNKISIKSMDGTVYNSSSF